MVGDYAHCDVRLRRLAIAAAREFCDLIQNRTEDVRIIIRLLSLHHHTETLKAHTRINHALWQSVQCTVGFAVILHKDEIPNLNHLRMIFIDQFASCHGRLFFGRAYVYMDFRARSARARLTHFPEVVVLIAIDDVVFGEVTAPDGCRLIISRKSLIG